MTKPKNFPNRLNQRRRKTGSPNAVPGDLTGVKTKKLLADASPERRARRKGFGR